MEERAELYASAVKDKGAPLDNCVVFIDCSKYKCVGQEERDHRNGLVIRGTNASTVLSIRQLRPLMD